VQELRRQGLGKEGGQGVEMPEMWRDRGAVMNWEVGIEGAEFDICEIRKLADAFGCQVTKSLEGRFFLLSNQFQNLGDAGGVSVAAKKMLDRLNGVAKLSHRNHRPICLSGIVHSVAPNGQRGVAILLPSTEIRMRENLQLVLTRTDGTTENRNAEDPELERARRIANDPRLMDLVEVFSGETSWQRLRVAFEKVSVLLGRGDNALVKNRYATRAELDQFKANVQDPRHSGHDAVHGVPHGALKGARMSKQEGFEFVKRLINTYVDHLA
jgi:hypothetical protein